MGYRLFRAFFGTTPQVCEIVWHMLSTRRPPHSTPHHLLWGFLLLKQYNIESVNAVLVGVSEKTFRKWSLMYIQLIANLPVVKIFFIFTHSEKKLLFLRKFISLISKGVLKTHLKAPLRSSLLTAPTFQYWSPLNSTRNGFRINSEDLVFAMKLDFASERGILFGPTVGTLAANGPT